MLHRQRHRLRNLHATLQVRPHHRVDRSHLDVLLPVILLRTPRKQTGEQPLPRREALLHKPVHHGDQVHALAARDQLALVVDQVAHRKQTQEVQVAQRVQNLLPALAQVVPQLPHDTEQGDERQLRRRLLSQEDDELDRVVLPVLRQVLGGDARELGQKVDETVQHHRQVEVRADVGQHHEVVKRKLQKTVLLHDLQQRSRGRQLRAPQDRKDVPVVHAGVARLAVLEEDRRVRDELLHLGNRRLAHHVDPLLVAQLVVRRRRAREDLLARDRLVHAHEQVLRQLAALVHVAVRLVQLDKVLQLHAPLRLHVGVVQVRVQHDDAEAQTVRHVRVDQQVVLRRVLVRPLRKRLHDAVDLLRLAGKAEGVQEHAQRRQQRNVLEVERPHVREQRLFVLLRVLPQVLADLLLVQSRREPQKVRNVGGRRGVRNQPRLLQVLDALLRRLVEDQRALLERALLQLRLPQHLRGNVVGTLLARLARLLLHAEALIDRPLLLLQLRVDAVVDALDSVVHDAQRLRRLRRYRHVAQHQLRELPRSASADLPACRASP